MGNIMEIAFRHDSSFSLKTKLATLIINSGGQIEVEGIVIAGPGEYEVKGFAITGFKGGAYLIETEEIRLGYLTDKEEVDVLLTNSWEAAKNTQPNMVIPIDKVTAEAMIKASGLEPKNETKLTVNRLNLPEETELVILNA